MRRFLLCAFALMGGFALSCQVFPGAQQTAEETREGTLPAVAAAPVETVLLADKIAQIEGGRTPQKARATSIRRLVEIFGERHTGLSQWEIEAVATTIVDECARNGLEISLVMAVIHVESAGYHRAVSPVGALGLMQIMPDTGRELAREQGFEWHGEETLFDPVVNVRLGIAYLRELSDRYDHVPTALAAYNWGPGRIDRRIRRGAKMPELYVEQVMRAYEQVIDDPTPGASS